MELIDVSDLPKPFQEAVRAVVDTFRRQLAKDSEKKTGAATRHSVKLSICKGAAIGSLSRDQIYDDRA